jgi:hypothetical protein
MTEQWDYEYLPFISNQTGKDIPNFRIYRTDNSDDNEHYIAETNENLTANEQERHARLIAASLNMYEALKYQEMADADPAAARRKGYYEEAARSRRIALAKAEGRE